MATATAMEKTTSRRPRIRTLTTRTLESIRPSDTPEVFEAIFLAMKPVYHFLEVPRVILFGLESLVYRTLPSTLELYKTRLLESREYPVGRYSGLLRQAGLAGLPRSYESESQEPDSAGVWVSR